MEQNKTYETPVVDPEVTVALNASEVFQLNLCVIARIGAVQQKWANASSEAEQSSAEAQLSYLSNLSGKLQNILKEVK